MDVEDALAEVVVLGAFCAELIACVALGVPMPFALLVGLAMFCGYGRYRGHGARELARMCADGVCSASGVIQSFILIGALTALWRACGTVSQIMVMVTPLVTPATAPLSVFLLCSLMSFLTGTAFGTSATMGVVSMTMASSMGANPLVCGGAVLAGAYFGDRCSPMSSSALLVRSVTGTRMSDNFKAMMRSSAVPFVGTVAIYAAAGLLLRPSGSFGSASTATALAAYFDQGIVALLPVVPVIVFPLMHIGMKRSMMASIVVAALVCVAFRGIAPMDVAAFSLLGFRASNSLVSRLMSGGGVVSMLNVTAIVCLASSFVGLFEGTGLLDGVRNHMEEVADRIDPLRSNPRGDGAGEYGCLQPNAWHHAREPALRERRAQQALAGPRPRGLCCGHIASGAVVDRLHRGHDDVRRPLGLLGHRGLPVVHSPLAPALQLALAAHRSSRPGDCLRVAPAAMRRR